VALAFGAELAPSETMEVQVINGHTCRRTDVEGEPVSTLAYPFLACDLRSHYEHASENGGVFTAEFAGVGDVLFRYHHEVHRRTGIDIEDRRHQVIIIEAVGG